jgi:hypothetical protein
MPDKKTAPMASLHGRDESPQPGQGVPLMSPVGLSRQAGAIEAKKPFKPILGATDNKAWNSFLTLRNSYVTKIPRATGTLTKAPIMNVNIPADKVVAKKTPFTLIPVLNGPAIMTPFRTMI